MSRNGSNRWVAALLAWFRAGHRDMPWRADPSPYRVWISEVMLQQTQVVTVIPYFTRFIARFPDPASLAAAPYQDLLKVWEGLGYYIRARNLHRAAQVVMAQHNGQVPNTFEALRALPGVGRYTAAAIASIAFHEAVPVVDGNVLRVLSRFLGRDADIGTPAARDWFFDYLKKPIESSGDPSSFNQAIMELGALLCTPRNPNCTGCPIAAGCRARIENRTTELPVKAKRGAVRHETIGVGIVFDSKGRILIARRKEGLLGGLWEFPGGKRKGREKIRGTVIREVLEETGLTVETGQALPPVAHAYSHFTVTIHPFICKRINGRAKALASDEIRWVKPDDLKHYPFPAANRKIEATLFRCHPLICGKHRNKVLKNRSPLKCTT
jgi:A/G-specific adenine glycosylase